MNKINLIFLRYVIVLLFPFLFIASSCVTKTHKTMEETFDADALGAPPPQFPAPNPPADALVWTQTYTQPIVVERPGGGKWVHINIKENYFTRNSAHVLQSYTEAFTMGAKGGIRGSFTLRLVGSGIAYVFLYSVQGENLETSPLGGYEVREGIGSADVAYLTSTNVPENFSNPFPPPGGIFLSSYKAGQTLDFSWSINQQGPLLYMNVSPGGNAPPVDIPKNSGKNGVSNIPIQKIMLIITAYEWQKNTSLFVDDIKIEEY